MNKFLSTIGKAVSKLNPNDVRQTAEQPVHIGISAADDSRLAAMRRFLLPDGMSKERVRVSAAHIFELKPEISQPQYDIDIYDSGLPLPKHAFTFYPQDPGRTIAQILAAKEELGIPLARQFPVFRPQVVDRIIQDICQENALFAIATALPNIIPGMALPFAAGEFASDTAILTMNQMRMAFMMAGASDRPIGYREQKSEIASVIAGAFGWRAIARELAGKIPFGGGIVPKAAISYAGTWVAGKSLERLYRVGHGYSRAERHAIYDEGLAKGKKAALFLMDKARGKAG